MFLEKSVIIEFNGLPATGKTTIANHLSSILKHEKIFHQRSYVRRWWEKFGRTVFVDPCCSFLFYLLLRFANQIIPRKSRLTHIGGELYHYRTYRNFLREKNSFSPDYRPGPHTIHYFYCSFRCHRKDGRFSTYF